MRKTFGCLMRGTALIVLLGIIGVVAFSFIDDGESEKYTLLGEVLVMADEGISIEGDTCTATFWDTVLVGGENIWIGDGTDEGINTTLAEGFVTGEGNCSFEFVADVEDTDIFGFTVHGRTEIRRSEQIGKHIPEGLGHTKEADGDWWVTIGPGQFDE